MFLNYSRHRHLSHTILQTLKPVGCCGHADAKALPNTFMKAAYRHGGMQIQDMGKEIIGNVRLAVFAIG